MNEFEQLKTEASNTNAISNDQQYDLMVAQVNESYQAVVDQEKKAINEGMKAVVMGLRLGMMLTLLKEQTPHGGWEKLFAGAEKRIGEANVHHVGHFKFGKSTAHNYMKTYKNSLKNLKGERPDLLDEALNQEGPMTIEVVKKATLGAETLRQAMLNSGAIKGPRREGDAPRQANRSTIEQNRNTLGGPKKEPIDSQQAIDLMRKEATTELYRIVNELMCFANQGRLAHVHAEALTTMKSAFCEVQSIADEINNK